MVEALLLVCTSEHAGALSQNWTLQAVNSTQPESKVSVRGFNNELKLKHLENQVTTFSRKYNLCYDEKLLLAQPMMMRPITADDV